MRRLPPVVLEKCRTQETIGGENRFPSCRSIRADLKAMEGELP